MDFIHRTTIVHLIVNVVITKILGTNQNQIS